MARQWLGSALWRWEQFLSKAALCLINFYLLNLFICFSGAGAGQGQALSGAGQSGAGGAGASRGLRKAPCPCGPECVTCRVLRDTRAPPALWKGAFATRRPRCTLAASHLQKSIVFVSLALPPGALLRERERGRDSARCYRMGWLGKRHRPWSNSNTPAMGKDTSG